MTPRRIQRPHVKGSEALAFGVLLDELCDLGEWLLGAWLVGRWWTARAELEPGGER